MGGGESAETQRPIWFSPTAAGTDRGDARKIQADISTVIPTGSKEEVGRNGLGLFRGRWLLGRTNYFGENVQKCVWPIDTHNVPITFNLGNLSIYAYHDDKLSSGIVLAETRINRREVPVHIR